MIEYQGQPMNEVVNSNEVVLVQYYADWCGPCQMLKPILEQLSTDMTDIKFYRVNIENHRDLAVSAKVQSIPTVVLYKNGTEVAREAGFKPRNLMEQWIKANA